MFWSICAWVVPGMGTIQGFWIISHASAIGAGAACFRSAHRFTTSTSVQVVREVLRREAGPGAKRIFNEELDAATAGYRVGYNDASHFSREYMTFFGEPPMRDVEPLQEVAREDAM